MGLHVRAAAKGTEVLRRMLNEAIARELAGSTQFIWHYFHVMAAAGGAFADLREIYHQEVRHAEAIAERLCRIGGLPTRVPRPFFEGNTAGECLHLALRSKEENIQFYRAAIEQAEKEGDAATAFLLEEILEEEEQHRDLFTILTEERAWSPDANMRPGGPDMKFKPGSDSRPPKENAAAGI